MRDRAWDNLGVADFFARLAVLAFVIIRGAIIVAVPLALLFVLAAMVKWAAGEIGAWT